MALTYTPAGALGFPLPDFTLDAVDGVPVRAADLVAKATLVAFICNHCPYVKAIEDRLVNLAREFEPRGLKTIAICSNDPTDHPEDRPEALLERARARGYPFPYLVDQDQSVARLFDAVCTPDFFVFGADRRLTYRGRLDDSWRDPKRVSRRELAEAVDLTLAGRAIATEQNPSLGCSIKWRLPSPGDPR